MIEAFIFAVVVVAVTITFSALAYLADVLLRRKIGRGIVPEDYYK
jgi:preprotein translocase subunit SecE